MLSFFLSGQPGTLLGLWWGYYRSCDPCTGASIPCFLFYLCNVQTANWRTSICSGRSWRSVLPWGLLQVNMRFRWELKIIKRILTCLLASKWPIKEVCSKMQCLQPINHSKRRRYWQLHCRMPGALVPWELLQMRGRKMSKWCHVKNIWQHRCMLNPCSSCFLQVCVIQLSPEPNEHGCYPLEGRMLCKACHLSLISGQH